MTNPAEFEARLTALETDLAQLRGTVAAAASDAAAARHLAAARDRDLADLTIKVDANRQAINALGVQTAAGFAEMRTGFAEMRAKLDQTSAGMAQIVELLTTRDDQ
ncbi:hypothetical protein [uncultured Pseudonocardia sp.]|uniref:hypothetical protein n=1 Tax=uncultured Pseudonocardia sp. TaxID=211455 RepID=UPI00260CA2BD|nr:hypothetical protein [uncultured Pseudonocardia sp.]